MMCQLHYTDFSIKFQASIALEDPKKFSMRLRLRPRPTCWPPAPCAPPRARARPVLHPPPLLLQTTELPASPSLQLAGSKREGFNNTCQVSLTTTWHGFYF